jgi:hypothetical protein
VEIVQNNTENHKRLLSHFRPKVQRVQPNTRTTVCPSTRIRICNSTNFRMSPRVFKSKPQRSHESFFYTLQSGCVPLHRLTSFLPFPLLTKQHTPVICILVSSLRIILLLLLFINLFLYCLDDRCSTPGRGNQCFCTA